MRWTGSRMAGCDFCEGGGPLVWSVDRDGVRTAVHLDISDAGYIGVRDVAAGPDGSMAVVGLAIGNSRMSTFISLISADGAHQTITQAWPYSPKVVAFAQDGTIWTVGAMMNDNHRIVYPAYLRHYAPSGQLLASTMIRPLRLGPGGSNDVGDLSTLMVSGDRIGWLSRSCQYFEFSMDGAQIGSYTCPNGIRDVQKIANVALSADNHLLIQLQWATPLAPLELDRTTGAWTGIPVLRDAGNTYMMLGFDGASLVTCATTPRGSIMRRYDWADGGLIAGRE
jgi:hypothetical protein